MSTPEKDSDFYARVARTVGAVPEAEVAELRKDCERLNFLQMATDSMREFPGYWEVRRVNGNLYTGSSVREAIDAAMNRPSP